MNMRKICIYVIIFYIGLFCSYYTFAQEADGGYTATTINDPKIPVEDLELLLKPLTKEELIIEADAWWELLQSKVKEISDLEIKMREKSREIIRSKEEIEKAIEQIQKTQEQLETQENVPEENAQQTEDVNDTVTQAEQQLQEKVETINQSISEVNDVSQVIQDNNSVEQLSSTERDLVAKAEEVNEAREKLQETINEIARSDMDLEEKVQKIGEAENELNTKLKEQMLVTINKLREEKTGLIDRFNVVLAALKLKGGEVEDYEKYVAAVSGLDVSMESFQDVSTFKIMVIGWLKSSEGGLRWLKNIIFFVITIIISYILAVIVGRITHQAVTRSKKFSDLLKQFFVSTARKAVLILGFIIALSMLEINIAPLLAGLGVAGFVIGFALQGTLSNFASGLMILMYRPYDVGHIIEAAGIKGVVNSMNLVSTTIKTFDNQIIVVPNGSIWGGVITNVTGSETRRVDMIFGIGYSDDISKAARILEDIVSSHESVLADPAPIVKLHELGDSSVNFVCRPWVKTADYWTVYWDVTRAVKERFDKEGVSIPFPQRDVHLYKANED